MSQRTPTPDGIFETTPHAKFTNAYNVYETGSDVWLGWYHFAEYANPCFWAHLGVDGVSEGDPGKGFDSARQARAYLKENAKRGKS
jgi:hypothetical protein